MQTRNSSEHQRKTPAHTAVRNDSKPKHFVGDVFCRMHASCMSCKWHTHVWNCLDIDWVYIEHNKMHQVSGLTSPNISTKLHPKVLSRQKSWQKSWQPTGIRGNPICQWDRSLKIGTSRILLRASIQGEEATAMVETKQRLTGTKPGCIFLARFSHMHYKHQQAASGL